MEGTKEKNKLLKKAFTMMYPAAFILAFMTQIEEFIDSLLSGSFLGEDAISAVAIGWPGVACVEGISIICYIGVTILIAISVGRGDKKESDKLYSIGMIGVTGLMTIISIGIILFPQFVVMPFSGGASEELVELAKTYARSFGFVMPLFILEGVLSQVLAVYGYEKEVAIINVVGIPINIFASIWGIKVFGKFNPKYAIAGLVFGYLISTAYQVIALIIVKRKRKINLKIVKFKATFKEYIEIIRYGFPGGINYFIDAAICSVINLILVQNIGEKALSFYLILESITLLGRVAAEAGGNGGAPLFGLLYGARDKNGLKASLKEGISVSLIFTVVWELILYISLPIVLPFFGVEYASADYFIVHKGILISLLLLPCYMLIKCLTNFFEATGHTKRTMALAIIPDSIIFPVSLLVFIKIFKNKYNAVWFSFAGCYLIYLVLMYIVHIIKTRRLKWEIEDFLLIKDEFKEKVLFDFSTTTESNEKNSNISENVVNFLKEQKYSDRISNMCGLCLEELNADFMTHIENNKKDKKLEKEVMDIKLISNKGKLHMIIRNIAKPYNPLDFEFNKDDFSKLGIVMVQKFAKKIEYSYIYGMNVITIDF